MLTISQVLMTRHYDPTSPGPRAVNFMSIISEKKSGEINITREETSHLLLLSDCRFFVLFVRRLSF